MKVNVLHKKLKVGGKFDAKNWVQNLQRLSEDKTVVR